MIKYVFPNGSGINNILNAAPSARHVNTAANAGAKITIAILTGKINLLFITNTIKKKGPIRSLFHYHKKLLMLF